MAIDTQPFPMNVLDLEGKKVLLRPEAAEAANKSNVVIGEPRKVAGNKTAGRQVTVSRQPDGGEVIKITINNPALGGQGPRADKLPPRFIKPKSPEVGRWKTNNVKYRPRKTKPTFDMLLNKCVRQAGSGSRQWQHGKRPRSPSAGESS